MMVFCSDTLQIHNIILKRLNKKNPRDFITIFKTFSSRKVLGYNIVNKIILIYNSSYKTQQQYFY